MTRVGRHVALVGFDLLVLVFAACELRFCVYARLYRGDGTKVGRHIVDGLCP